MNWATRLRYLDLLRRHAATPIPLMLDCVHLLPTRYLAVLKNGLRFYLHGGHGEWHSLLECAIRMDYLRHGIQLHEGDVVIDIGANIGAFSIVAAHRVGKRGRVFSYEPNPSAFGRLIENIELNGLTNVVAYNDAVGMRDGTMKLYLSNNSTFSAAYKQVDDHVHSGDQYIDVRMRSMRSVLQAAGPRVRLLKMDCEGSEYDILRSVDAKKFSSICQIAMEVHQIKGRSKAEIAAALKILGFEIMDTFPMTAFRADRVDRPTRRRTLGLPLAVLYGLGVTIGAQAPCKAHHHLRHRRGEVFSSETLK